MTQKIPLGSCFRWILRSSMLKESIRDFTSNFVAICSATSYSFGFWSRSKRPPLDILSFLVTTMMNQDKKVAFIRVDEEVAMARSSEFMKTCHNINIIVQTTSGDAYSLNDKIESPVVVVFRPPVREVCPNYEGVVYQPHTLTTTHIGSRRLTLNSNLSLLPNLFPLYFLDCSFPPLLHCLPIRRHSYPKPSRFTHSPPLLQVQSSAYLGVSLTRHLSAPAARPCTLLRVPASTIVSLAGALPPFPTSACTQVPVMPWRVCPFRVPLSICVPDSPSPSSHPNNGIARSLVSLLG